MKKHYFLIFWTIFLTSLSNAQQLTTVYTGSSTLKSCLLIDDNLYFTDANKVLMIDITEENPTASVILSSLNNPVGLEFKDGFLYVCVFNDGNIIKIDLNNLSSSPVIVTSVGQTPNMLKFYGDFLYYSDNNDNGIYRYDTINNVTESFIGGIQGPIGLDIKDNNLYYSVVLTGKIFKISLTDTNPVPIEIISGLINPLGIEFKDDELFIADITDGKISKANITENPVVTQDVLTDLMSPRDITFNGNTMYVVYGTIIAKVDLSLGIDENTINNSIELFPNPSNDFIQLSNLNSSLDYIIYDINGRRLTFGEISINQQIDISFFSSGCYFIKLEGISSPLRFIKN